MSQINSLPMLPNDLREFQEQALRCVNDAIFTLNNLRGKFY
jgi:hypothetical protein